MEANSRSRGTIPRCHECGRPVFNRRELVYHQTTFGEPSLWGVKPDRSMFQRRPFHRECWRIRRRREMVNWLLAFGIFLALVLVPVLIRLIK